MKPGNKRETVCLIGGNDGGDGIRGRKDGRFPLLPWNVGALNHAAPDLRVGSAIKMS